MSAASRYWLLLRIDATGRRVRQEIAPALAFFAQIFPQFVAAENVPDASIQRLLVEMWQTAILGSNDVHPAELCLRCFISSTIEQVVVQLETSFGNNYGFTRHDLFPFVLNDIIVERPMKGIGISKTGENSSNPHSSINSSYTSLASEILQTFNPDRSSLSSWTAKLVRQHSELRAFLVEHGVYLVTDWAILNDTSPEQLQRVLVEFHHLSAVEIEQATILLESYHAVYRRDRRTARKTGTIGQCRLPTSEQLQQIAQQFNFKTNHKLQPSDILTQLQDLAELLRQYRIYIKSGSCFGESLDNPIGRDDNNPTPAEQIPYTEPNGDEEEQIEFLQFYRQQFIDCLDTALSNAIKCRRAVLQRQNEAQVEKFTLSLHLYHCQGKSMGEIATIVGLQAQYQVTRLLKLKELRADVRQLMLKSLLKSVLDQAIVYTDLQEAKKLEQKIEIALDEQVNELIHKAEAESSVAKHCALKSLFARRLCKILARSQALPGRQI